MYFIPTYSSWLNLVERFFALITAKAIHRGSFGSVSHPGKQGGIAIYYDHRIQLFGRRGCKFPDCSRKPFNSGVHFQAAGLGLNSCR